MTEICVVAPIYNEEALISEFVNQVSRNLSSLTNDYEIILIDDGSQDSSWEIIRKEVAKNDKIKALKFSRNFGHHYAISAGLNNSNSSWTVVMDSDLQDRPEIIPVLYRKAKEGYPVVFVTRTKRPEPFYYLFFQKLFYVVLNLLSGLKFNSKQANFSIIHRDVVEAFNNFPEHVRFYGSTIKWLGFDTTEVEAEHGNRFSGRPSYTLKKRIQLAADIILSFSDRPLKFAIGFGMAMFLISLSLTSLIVFRTIRAGFVEITPSIVLGTVCLIGGSILVVLGIIGVYLSRVFTEVKKRPLYVISDKI
jgi:glycosyltransferase involved in cell wall biosynthesis